MSRALAETIDEVIYQLTDIVVRSRREGDCKGYFAALYRKVTVRVRDGIEQGRFEDGPRMERLDVIFANRYLEAYRQYLDQGDPSACWRLAFDTTAEWRPIILQHLLLGMNAHINLDLGIAAVEAEPGDSLQSLRRDFNEINSVLSELVQPVQDEIGAVSPWIGFLDKIDRHADDVIVNFSMDRARQAAWRFAEELNVLNSADRETAINRRDREVHTLGRVVRKPGRFVLPLGLLAIRLRESYPVARVIDQLSREDN